MRVSSARGPCSNAARAAFTAFSTSAESASATWQISSPVEGLTVPKVLPETLGIHWLLIRSLVAEIRTRFSAGDDMTEAIDVLLLKSLQDAVSYKRRYHVFSGELGAGCHSAPHG